MDKRSWMYGRRDTTEYQIGLPEFIECAREHMRVTRKLRIEFPCQDCQNIGRHRNIETLRDHLVRRGFVEGYTRWTKHGEVVEEDEVTSRLVPDVLRGHGVQTNVENVEINVENLNAENVENVEADEMMNELEQDFADIPGVFEGLGKEKDVALYPGCTSYTKIKAVFKLFNLKAKNGWSDKSFTSLLELLKEMLPEKMSYPNRHTERNNYCAL